MDKPQGPTVYHSIAIQLFLNEIKKEKKISVYLELKFNWVFCILPCNPEEEGRKEEEGLEGTWYESGYLRILPLELLFIWLQIYHKNICL